MAIFEFAYGLRGDVLPKVEVVAVVLPLNLPAPNDTGQHASATLPAIR